MMAKLSSKITETQVSGKRAIAFAPATGRGFVLQVRQHVECADGAHISVQASGVHYSIPQNDKGPYTNVELSKPDPLPEWWTTADGIMYFVTADKVLDYIESHGGQVD